MKILASARKPRAETPIRVNLSIVRRLTKAILTLRYLEKAPEARNNLSPRRKPWVGMVSMIEPRRGDRIFVVMLLISNVFVDALDSRLAYTEGAISRLYVWPIFLPLLRSSIIPRTNTHGLRRGLGFYCASGALPAQISA